MGDMPASVRLTEVKINNRNLRKGMEVTLPKAPGRRAGRYRFDWAEQVGEDLLLNVYGPISGKGIAHYRTVRADAVRTVHHARD